MALVLPAEPNMRRSLILAGTALAIATLLPALVVAGGGPAQETLTDSGRIACAVTVQTTTIQPGHGQIPNLPPCGENDHQLVVEAQPLRNITGVCFELVWQVQPSVLGNGDELQLLVPTWSPTAQGNMTFEAGADDTFNEQTHKVIGKSPLTLKLKINDNAIGNAHLYLFTLENNDMGFVVSPPSSLALHSTPPVLNVIIDQEFTLFVSLFYEGAGPVVC